MNSIGFTGTQKGMTNRQKWAVRLYVRKLLSDLGTTYVHHGGCVGSDAYFHNMLLDDDAMRALVKIVVHPCNIPDKQFSYDGAHQIMETLPPLERNRNITRHAQILLATPRTYAETLRSGTWATIRYMHQLGRPVRIWTPSGDLISK